MNKRTKGISLTEIMIVMTIIAIIAGIFLAMPKKDVTKTDKMKYYVVYNMLDTMQNGILARNGNANSSNFCNTVNSWLNVTPNNPNCTCNGRADRCVTLINGMNLFWTINDTTNDRIVTVDLDGLGNGLDTNKKDQHEFTLHSAAGHPVLVEPDTTNNAAGQGAGLNATWCEFRVYQLDATNAHKNYNNGIARATYSDAADRFNTCNANHNNTCFIEIVKQTIKQ